MLRKSLNLDLVSLDSFSILFYGLYNSGKTWLAGHLLKDFARDGPVRFLDVRGQQGWRTLATLGLGNIRDEADTKKDLDEALDYYASLNLAALLVETPQDMSKAVMEEMFGENVPKIGKGKNDENEWGPYHNQCERLLRKLKKAAKVVAFTNPADKYLDPFGDRVWISPDLPGRQSKTVVGEIDFVLYLKADTIGPGNVRRILQCSPSGTVYTRARVPKQLRDIEIPTGEGAWITVKNELQKAMGLTVTG